MDTTVAKRIFKEKGIGNDAIALFFYLQYSTQAGRVPGLARQTKALTKFEKEPFVVLKELWCPREPFWCPKELLWGPRKPFWGPKELLGGPREPF